MQWDIVDPSDIDRWNDLVLNFEAHSVFHSREWCQVLRESYGYLPHYFLLKPSQPGKAVIPLLEVNSWITGKRGVSLPFSDFCSPLIDGQDGLATWEILKQHGKKAGWRTLQLRGEFPVREKPSASQHYFGHLLDFTQSPAKIYSRFRPTTHRNIKTARRKNISVEFFNSREAIHTFYHLNCQTRKRHGLPPQPLRFFENLYTYMISRQLGWVVLASLEGKIIAGVVLLCFGKRAVFKFGASDHRFKSTNANYLIIWEIIQKCFQESFETLHFGRTHPAAQGLIQFKRGWGSREYPINYYNYDLQKNRFAPSRGKETGIHTLIFRNMPESMLRVVGHFLYRHLG